MDAADPIAAPLQRATECSFRLAMASLAYGRVRRARELARHGAFAAMKAAVAEADERVTRAHRDWVVSLGELAEVAPGVSRLMAGQWGDLSAEAERIGATLADRDPRGLAAAPGEMEAA